jgi:hypothetical protein
MLLEKIKPEGTAGKGIWFYRMQKAGIKEVDCDPACLVKGRKKMAKILSETYGKFGYISSVARLDAMGAPHVMFGSIPSYCPATYFLWLENIYQPIGNGKNLNQHQVNYDITSGSIW